EPENSQNTDQLYNHGDNSARESHEPTELVWHSLLTLLGHQVTPPLPPTSHESKEGPLKRALYRGDESAEGGGDKTRRRIYRTLVESTSRMSEYEWFPVSDGLGWWMKRKEGEGQRGRDRAPSPGPHNLLTLLPPPPPVPPPSSATKSKALLCIYAWHGATGFLIRVSGTLERKRGNVSARPPHQSSALLWI
ncbi:hypothetical protein JZ751_006145, partial [Albula glossodonta]